MDYNLERKLDLEMNSRGYKLQTKKLYKYYIKRFLNFVGGDVENLSEEDLKRYIEFILQHNSKKTANFVISAIQFFYRFVLNKNINLQRPVSEKKIPEILTKAEVKILVDSCSNLKHRLFLKFLYGCGLRLDEARKIKLNDLRLDEKLLHISLGKNDKDRIIPLVDELIKDVRMFIDLEKPPVYLFFTSRNREKPISKKTGEMIVKLNAKKAGLRKKVTPHLLRHSFATHLLESGIDIRIIQKLLGHSKLETTSIYTQISSANLKDIKMPLDNL